MEAVAKQRRSVVKKQKKEADKIARQKGAVTAFLKNVPTSPRKMRLVADLVRGHKVNDALGILKFQAKTGAAFIEKLLVSAIASWQAKNEDTKIEDADLFVKEIFVDGGRILKRLRPAPQGRAHRIRKRSNHITLMVDSLAGPGGEVSVTAEVAEPKVEKKESVKTSSKNEVKEGSDKPAVKKTTKKNDNQ